MVLYCIAFFGMGYALGRLDNISSLLRRAQSDSFVAQAAIEQRLSTRQSRLSKVSIDDSKMVTSISTSDLEPSGKRELGTVTQTEDSVASSANKLAQLKKTKG